MGKIWKSVKKVFKKAAPVVGAIAGNAILPGIGGAMAGAFLGSVVAGNNTRQHLFSAGAAGVGAAAGGAVGGAGGKVAEEGAKQVAQEAGKQALTQGVAQTGTQAGTQTLAQSGTQALAQSGTQVTAQEATKATFAEGAKQFLSKHATSISIGSAASTGAAMGTKVKTPSIDNTEETEFLKREKEYEKRKRSSLFETKGGAAGERVGYTGSENRGSIFGN